MKLTENESIFLQALATTSLIAELNNSDFLNSEYYKKINFVSNDKIFKEILNNCGIGNPATMQMFLYTLLVMPKEIFKEFDNLTMKNCQKEINSLCIGLVEPETNSTYSGENNINNINYYGHIRNAVSHAKCSYKKSNGICYVEFYDQNIKNTSETCHIIIKTLYVGTILERLQKQLMEFIKKQLYMQ